MPFNPFGNRRHNFAHKIKQISLAKRFTMNVFITWMRNIKLKNDKDYSKMQFRQRKTHKSSSSMARSQPESHQVGSPLGFETKLRFWPRNGNYETNGSSKTTTKTKQPRMFPWSRLRKSRDDKPQNNFADTQGLVLPKSASSASSSTTEESQISTPPRNTNSRDTNSPRTFQGKILHCFLFVSVLLVSRFLTRVSSLATNQPTNQH